MTRRHLVAASALLGTLAFASTALAGTTTTNLPNGAALSVSVDTPLTGATFLVPQGQTTVDVPVAGTAAVGKGTPNAAWIYVIDVSGSTGLNLCSGASVVSCERTAVTTLNSAVVSDGSGLEVGLVVFADSSATADMAAAAGDQNFVAPSDSGVATVIGSVVVNGIGQFTPHSVGTGTNFAAGLQSALALVGATSAQQKNVVFLSDGESNASGTLAAFNTALASIAGANAKIFPFAVGSGSSCTGGTQGTLKDMADATGTACTVVADPANLPSIVVNLTATKLNSVALTIDAVANALDTLTPALPTAGPVTANYTSTALAQSPGTHQACATSTGTGPASDATKTGTAKRCESYDVYAFSVTPTTATNELSSHSSHAVVATLSGPAGKLAGYPVAFAVTGTNAGASGTCVPVGCKTDASGVVTFTYSVPVAPTSLGTDTIGATVTIGTQQGTAKVTKKWQDTTPPTAACPASVNPGGKEPKAPGNGGQGQNQDGFYRLTATDDVWPAGSIGVTVTDGGSGTVFGPFPVGTNIKYTQANAAPSIKAMTGAVQWQIKGTGDAIIRAIDGSGNVSAPVTCLVPRPPK